MAKIHNTDQDTTPDIPANQFEDLRDRIDTQRLDNVQRRIETNPLPNELEIRLGCFTEELQPQVLEIAQSLLDKGYVLSHLSDWGFDNDPRQQVIYGNFYFKSNDYLNSLIEKMKAKGVHFIHSTKSREIPGLSSFMAISFSPETVDLNQITQKWQEIAGLLSNHGKPWKVVDAEAKKFRERYAPHVWKFEYLREKTLSEISEDLKKRKTENPDLNEEEKILGTYSEEIEPQVRKAVLEFNRKGYKTQSSGFWGLFSEQQCIEGPFSIDGITLTKLKQLGVRINTENHYGLPYTSMIFTAKEADLDTIEEQWNQIVTLLPSLKSK